MVYESFNLGGITFNIDRYLRQKLDNIKRITKRKWDCVVLIDGIEGSGKSTLSFLVGWYLTDGNLTMDNVCEGSEDAMKKMQVLKPGSVLIIDEGSLSFSSKEVMSKEQKQLTRILNVIRQRGINVIIVSPSFFNLNKYVAIERSRFLLHVYTDKDLNRGRYCYFGQRKKHVLYVLGKKNFNSYAKPRSDFVGMFPNFEPPFYKEYLKYKESIIQEQFKPTITAGIVEKNTLKDVYKRIKEFNPEISKKIVCKWLNVADRTLYTWDSLGKPQI